MYGSLFHDAINKMGRHLHDDYNVRMIDAIARIAVVGKSQKFYEQFLEECGYSNSGNLWVEGRFTFIYSIETSHGRPKNYYDVVVFLRDADQLSLRTLSYIWLALSDTPEKIYR